MERVSRALRKALLALAVGISCGVPGAFADKFNTETSSDARALGMGNAAINTERGAYGVFYNPANIAAKDTGTNIQLVNMQMEMNDGALAQLGRAKFPNFLSLSSLYSNLNTQRNSYESGRFSIFPNFTVRNLSVGMLYEVNQGAEVRSYDGALRVKARDRFAPTAALSFRMAGGIFRFGLSAQYLTVGDADTAIRQPISSGTLDFKNSIQSGAGLVATAGTTLTLPFRFLPSFSIVGRNLGDTKFTKSPFIKFGNGRAVATQPMTFDFAYSMVFYLARRLEMKTEVDYRDTVNQLHGGRFRHVFLGTEFIFYDFLRLRTGIAHGYTSFGLGVSTGKASLDLAAYADEKDDSLRGAKDQRYVLQYTWELFQ